MDRNEQTLSLIGLCLRGRNLEVGEDPVEAVARARDARVLLLASDAADNTARRVRRFAEMGQCVWLRVPFTKRELGLATGRASAAVAAITDIGLAVAVVRRLAEAEPEKVMSPQNFAITESRRLIRTRCIGGLPRRLMNPRIA